MKRPMGVVLLSVLFSCLSGALGGMIAFGIWAAHFGHLANNPLFIVGMAELLLGLMLFGFIAYGLWDMDEDARWATFSMFAGPAGLATAVYAASGGLSVVVLDCRAFGGQAGGSTGIENYLGFP